MNTSLNNGIPRGTASFSNSSNTPLGANGEFVGAWQINDFEHVGVNVLADTQGTLTIEVGILKDGVNPQLTITDNDVTVTLTAVRIVYANAPYFRSLVKLPGRVCRVSYLNNGTPQTLFALITSYGSNLFPASVSDDNALLTTVVEKERNVGVAYGKTVSTASSWACLIDLSDTVNWPHERTGSVELSIFSLNIDKPVATNGSVVIGVVTAINGTSANITLLQGDSFAQSSGTEITIFRNFSPSQIKCGVVGGVTHNWLTTARLTGVTAVNTATPLDSPIGTATVTPAVGDILARFELTSGTAYTSSIQLIYHTDADA